MKRLPPWLQIILTLFVVGSAVMSLLANYLTVKQYYEDKQTQKQP